MADARGRRPVSHGDTVGWYLRDGLHDTPRFVLLLGMLVVAVAAAVLIYWLTS